MDTLNVTAAVIEHNYRYLVLRRGPTQSFAGLWEFPGGKIKPGESLQECITREIKEELGVESTAGPLLASVQVQQEGPLLNLFAIKVEIDKIPSKLIEHTDMRWVTYEELAQVAFIEADLSLVHQLQGRGAKELELARLSPKTFFKFYAVLNGLVGLFMAVFISLVPGMGPVNLESVIGSSILFRFGLAVGVFLTYTLLGGIFGLIIAGFYNLFSNLFGGVKMRFK